MKSQAWIFVVIAILLVVGVTVFFVFNSKGDSTTPSGDVIRTIPQDEVSQEPADMIDESLMQEETPIAPESNIIEFIIEADDDGFYINDQQITIITVTRGDNVKILFQVKKDRVYFNGLDFRGFNEDVGAKPGQSVEFKFIPTQSGSITSYWPSSGTVKERLTVEVI